VAPAPSIAVVVNLQPSPAAARACESAAPASQARPNFREEIKKRSRATTQFVGRPFWKCEHARRGDTCKLCVGEEEAQKVRARERRERLKREETDKDTKGRIVAAVGKRQETDKVRMLTKDAEGRVAAAAVEHRAEPTGKEKAHITGEEADIQRLDATGQGGVGPGDSADETAMTARPPPAAPAAAAAGPAQLGAMKVTELKLALKAQGLPTSGLKADLVQRLKSALERLPSKTQAGVAPPNSSKKRARQETDEEEEEGGGAEVLHRVGRETKCVTLPLSLYPLWMLQHPPRGGKRERERRGKINVPCLLARFPPAATSPATPSAKSASAPAFTLDTYRYVASLIFLHSAPSWQRRRMSSQVRAQFRAECRAS
jgi:hypothetical protein